MKVNENNLPIFKEKLAEFFKGREEIIFAYLFGSAARGRAQATSDLDIAVAVDPGRIRASSHRYGYAASLTSVLMQTLETNEIDLVLLHEVSPALKYRIFSEGLRIFCRNPELEKKTYLRAFREYQDTAPLRRVQSLYLNRYLRNLGSARFHG